MDEFKRSCVDCGNANCNKMDSNYPDDFCLTTNMNQDVLDEAMELYKLEENLDVAKAAALVESENYCKMTRIEETVEFAKKIGAKKIGIATCVGLLRESRVVANVFRANGFQVFGIGCKAGTQKKVDIGIPQVCNSTGVNICNPILQAKMLNNEKTDLNILVGLCVGHDSLFYKYSEGLVTTLVVKDRVLAHNPVGALYQTHSYYEKILK